MDYVNFEKMIDTFTANHYGDESIVTCGSTYVEIKTRVGVVTQDERRIYWEPANSNMVYMFSALQNGGQVKTDGLCFVSDEVWGANTGLLYGLADRLKVEIVIALLEV